MRYPATLSLALLAGVAAMLLFGSCQEAMSQKAPRLLAAKMRIASTTGEAIIVLYDNPVSRDFASLLPLAVTFRDYVGEEKIADIPRTLATAGGLTTKDVQGDVAYYAQWGNLAVFYKGFGKDAGLYILGRIESGKEWLAGQHSDFAARMEMIERPAQKDQQ